MKKDLLVGELTQKIDSYLSYLKEEKGTTLPFGIYTKIAKKFGVSRELVRQRAEGFNFRLAVKHKQRDLVCPVCQKTFKADRNNRRYCSQKCWMTHKSYEGTQLHTCTICGLGILVKKSNFKRSKTKQFYCSRKCYFQSDILKEIGKRMRSLYGSDYFSKISKERHAKKRILAVD